MNKESLMIRVNKDTKILLDTKKVHPRQTYDELINLLAKKQKKW